MRKQKNSTVVLFGRSLVLPGVVWLDFPDLIMETMKTENWLNFRSVNLESLGDFPEQFEAYYKDHVPFKNDLVKFLQLY